MNFLDKVNNAYNDFCKLNGYNANELILGLKEEKEFHDFVDGHSLLNRIQIDDLFLSRYQKKDIFMNLKVRYFDEDSYFRLEYNPHYE